MIKEFFQFRRWESFIGRTCSFFSPMTWTYIGNTDLIVDITARVATITMPSVDWNGSETITFRATDPGALFDEDAATFTVSADNDAPVVTDIPDQTISEGGTFTTINLDDYVSDVDNTDDQIITFNAGNSTLFLEDGGNVDLSTLIDDADNDTTNEIITFGELIDNELRIAEGEDTISIDISSMGENFTGWNLEGNAGTDPATNFIGTTDNNNLIFRTNNSEQLRIRGDNGFVGIGTVSDPTERLHVNGNIRIGNNV